MTLVTVSFKGSPFFGRFAVPTAPPRTTPASGP
jgi:hypothetical protein